MVNELAEKKESVAARGSGAREKQADCVPELLQVQKAPRFLEGNRADKVQIGAMFESLW